MNREKHTIKIVLSFRSAHGENASSLSAATADRNNVRCGRGLPSACPAPTCRDDVPRGVQNGGWTDCKGWDSDDGHCGSHCGTGYFRVDGVRGVRGSVCLLAPRGKTMRQLERLACRKRSLRPESRGAGPAPVRAVPVGDALRGASEELGFEQRTGTEGRGKRGGGRTGQHRLN